MLSSGINKTIRSYTSSSVLLSGNGPYLYSSQGSTQLCCDGAGFLYLSYTGSNYFKINPVTGVSDFGLATTYTVNSISVTKDGVVFFASGTSVYAVGGTYGSTPVLLFSPNGGSGVWLQTLAVNSTGTAVYCYDAAPSGSRYLCKYTAWSGGSATRTVISTADAGTNQYGAIALTDGGMVATGYGGLTAAPAYLQWCGPISTLDSTYIASSPGIPMSYGLAIDSDMSPIYVCGGDRYSSPPNNVAATLLRFLPGVRSSGISIPITAWGAYGVAVHPYTRAIYVLAVGLTSRTSTSVYAITLTPQY
jgi:hypothetical protein